MKPAGKKAFAMFTVNARHGTASRHSWMPLEASRNEQNESKQEQEQQADLCMTRISTFLVAPGKSMVQPSFSSSNDQKSRSNLLST